MLDWMVQRGRIELTVWRATAARFTFKLPLDLLVQNSWFLVHSVLLMFEVMSYTTGGFSSWETRTKL